MSEIRYQIHAVTHCLYLKFVNVSLRFTLDPTIGLRINIEYHGLHSLFYKHI
jgi:hypothetical protein